MKPVELISSEKGASMKTHLTYAVIIAALLAVITIAAPYAKKGYDLTVILDYRAEQQGLKPMQEEDLR